MRRRGRRRRRRRARPPLVGVGVAPGRPRACAGLPRQCHRLRGHIEPRQRPRSRLGRRRVPAGHALAPRPGRADGPGHAGQAGVEGQDAGVRTIANDILLSQQFENGVMAGQLRTWGLPGGQRERHRAWPGWGWPSPSTGCPAWPATTSWLGSSQLTGRDADALFLQLMIAHHEGRSPHGVRCGGAGVDPERPRAGGIDRERPAVRDRRAPGRATPPRLRRRTALPRFFQARNQTIYGGLCA